MRRCFKCKRWFHRDCLERQSKAKRDSNQASYLCPSPQLFATSDIHEIRFRGLPQREQAELTRTVRSLAQHPVARGMQYGVAGNCRYIYRAISLLRRITEEAETCAIPVTWRAYLGISMGKKLPPEAWRTCPVCGDSI